VLGVIGLQNPCQNCWNFPNCFDLKPLIFVSVKQKITCWLNDAELAGGECIKLIMMKKQKIAGSDEKKLLVMIKINCWA
jgi:hypothetical protein